MIQLTDRQAEEIIRSLRRAYLHAREDRCRNSIQNILLRNISLITRKIKRSKN